MLTLIFSYNMLPVAKKNHLRGILNTNILMQVLCPKVLYVI
jgi:hypothetical protein